MARLDATQIVDRERETGQFAAMLRGEERHRILVVSDSSGSGKSELLRKVRLLCRIEHDVPVALVDFADFEDKPDDWSIIEEITRQLRNCHLTLPRFDELDRARALADRKAFGADLGPVVGSVDVRGNATGGTIGGIVAQDDATINISEQPWTDHTERLARQQCRDAFLDDLAALGAERVVLIFDSVEKADGQVRNFLLDEIVPRTLTGGGGGQGLFGVLAGPELLPMVHGRLRADHHELVASASLERLSREHVEELLRAHRYEPDELYVKSMLVLLDGGRPLQEALNMAEMFCGKLDG